MSVSVASAMPAGPRVPPQAPTAPAKAGLVLGTLIIVAAVANLPLAMANVALPSIGVYFDASQTQLNLVAVAYSLGLACSVLWLGALGDRYGRKLMALLGVTLAIPAALHQRVCADDQRPDRRPALRRICGGHGLPDHPGPDRGIVGAGTGRARARSRCGRPSAARSRCRGPLLSGLSSNSPPGARSSSWSCRSR